MMSGESIENTHSARLVGIDNREDTLEDLEDFPPVPSTMVLPTGTMFPVIVRHLKAKKLKVINKSIREKKKKKKKKDKGEKLTPEEIMEEVAEKVDILFKVYDIFLGVDELDVAFKRVATWMKIKHSEGSAAAMGYEARCKRDDSARDAKEEWLDVVVASMEEARVSAKPSMVDVDIDIVVKHIIEDLDDFLDSSAWKEAVATYCEDPFATGWFRDDNSDVIDMFKGFLLKKYRTALLRRYKTILAPEESTVTSPAIDTLRASVEESLKRLINGILAAEEEYKNDLHAIAVASDNKKESEGPLASLAKSVISFFFGKSAEVKPSDDEPGIEGFPSRHRIS